MNRLSFLIKPSSSKCGLKCRYCFYHDIANNRQVKDYGFMDTKTIDNLIEKAFQALNKGIITFAFQGGEPTLVGINFYQYFINKVNEHKSDNIVKYVIQTNGINLDEKWIKLFLENDFLVGISLDGNKLTHDINRIDNNTNGTFDLVLKKINLLKSRDVKFNILTVVTKSLIEKIDEIYAFYIQQNFNHLQFIPLININNFNEVSSIQYGKFLDKLFNLWYEDISLGKKIHIKYFDDLLLMSLFQNPTSCELHGKCSIQFVVEGNGDVFPCDFYVYEQYKLGNINNTEIKDMFESDISQQFLKDSLSIGNECKVCNVYSLCKGGCKKYHNNKFIYCEGYKYFLTKNLNNIVNLRNLILKKN